MAYLFDKVQVEHGFGSSVQDRAVEIGQDARDEVTIVCAGEHTRNQIERPAKTV